MSQVFPLIDGWAGYGEGSSILLESGTPLDSEHPVVKARPELFTKPAAEKSRKAAPAKASDG